MYGPGGMAWMGLWWIAGVAALIALIWVVVRVVGGGASGQDSPEAILKRRYARGEIDKEQYERMLTDLRR